MHFLVSCNRLARVSPIIRTVTKPRITPNFIRTFSSMDNSNSHSNVADKAQRPATAELPALSAREFRAYNRLAEGMNMYHNHFRMEWDRIYSALQEEPTANTENPEVPPPKLSASKLIHFGRQFISHLTAHHNIEEQHIFPALGEKMAEFRHSESYTSPEAATPVQQHREIHAGLDRMSEYLSACRTGEKDFQRAELKRIMDSFKDVLWSHLNDEVALLGAENMRKYWTLDEMRTIPF